MNTFIPKKYKFKKIHKNVRIKKTYDLKLNELKSSICGLKILKSGTINSTVLEAARRIIKRKTKKIGILKINAFANIPITTKASGVRMGKGVGFISKWVSPVKKGRIIFELDNISIELAEAALKSAALKLNLPSKIIYNYMKITK